MNSSFDSDALKANLEETAVDEVIIAPSMLLLLEQAGKYKGIHNTLYELLHEIYHPYRNWTLILPRLRTFVLKNAPLYCRSSRKTDTFSRFTDLFFLALNDTKKNETLLALGMESLLAYVEKVITVADVDLLEFDLVLGQLFNRLYDLDNEIIMFMVQGHHPMKKIAGTLLDFNQNTRRIHCSGQKLDLLPTGRLMKKVLALNYQYWLGEEDPQPWFLSQCHDMCDDWQAGKLFNAISHDQIRARSNELEKIDIEHNPDKLAHLLELPSHMDLVRLYKEIPAQLATIQDRTDGLPPDRFAENRRLIFLFRIMRSSGLYLIHEESLREINRSLIHLIQQQTFEEIESFLLTTMQLLKENVSRYPHTALQCIQVLGAEVFNRENSRLVETFLWEAVRFGFQYANVTGIDSDWQPITNPAHLANIRVWINLIMQ